MNSPQETSQGQYINHFWDSLSLVERKSLILEHAEAFLEAGLLLPNELVPAVSISESELEYQVASGRQAIFSKLELENNVMTQKAWRNLREVLKSIFTS